MEIDNRIFFAATQSVVQKSIAGMLFVLMLSLLCLTTSGCERLTPQTGDNDIEKTDSNFTLQGTAWKLVGIVDTQTNMLTELEPKNCEKCYTFTFDTDTTANGKSIFCGTYILGLDPIIIAVDKAREKFDGYRYCELLLSVKSYTVDNNALKLYFEDSRNMYPLNSFLLYKPIKIVEQ